MSITDDLVGSVRKAKERRQSLLNKYRCTAGRRERLENLTLVELKEADIVEGSGQIAFSLPFKFGGKRDELVLSLHEFLALYSRLS